MNLLLLDRDNVLEGRSNDLSVDICKLALIPQRQHDRDAQFLSGQIAATIKAINSVSTSGLTVDNNFASPLRDALWLYVRVLLLAESSTRPCRLVGARSCDQQFLFLLQLLKSGDSADSIGSSLFLLLCAVHSLHRQLLLPLPLETQWTFAFKNRFAFRHLTLPGWEFRENSAVVESAKFRALDNGTCVEDSNGVLIAGYRSADSESLIFPELLSEETPPWSVKEALEPSATKRIVCSNVRELRKIWFDGFLTIDESVQFIIGLMRSDDRRWKSSSDPDLPGLIFTTLDADCPLETVEGIVHEAMHQRLHLVERIVSLTRTDAPRFRHAWRPDARPIRGVFLAVHAFYAVEQLYRSYLEYGSSDPSQVDLEYRRIQVGVSEGLECLLDSGALTDIGIDLVLSIREDRDRRMH